MIVIDADILWGAMGGEGLNFTLDKLLVRGQEVTWHERDLDHIGIQM